ncbi:MAG: HTTM domain-containing protein [Planctomycetaceae bacterium]|nr:HTTM domain-containing protein [Planctomycetaceae bacterium]
MSEAILPSYDSAASNKRRRFLARLFEPVSIAPLVQFRIALGAILLWEAYRYLSSGWPRSLFLEPGLLFHYYGFEWVRPLPERLHLAVFPVLGALAVCVTVGLVYRVAAVLLFFGWAYAFLLDQALYLNHLYLVTVIIGLSTVLPANRAFSIDAWMRPRLRSTTVPRWTLTLLRAQVGIVYFYGGIAKLNGDWLSGVPMQLMLLDRADLIGQPAGEPIVAYAFAYGGLLFDLFIVPLLWWRRTRLFGLLLAVGFHLTNHVLFQIGIFPWFMLAATLILWPPFPLSMISFARIYGALVLVGMLLTPLAGREVPSWSLAFVPILIGLWTLRFWAPEWLAFDVDPDPDHPAPAADVVPTAVRPAVLALLTIYLGWQMVMPFRHLAYPGDVSWHEQGHKWSWHMKLRVKNPAEASFFVLDQADRAIGMYRLAMGTDGFYFAPIMDPAGVGSPLSPRQSRTMVTRPDLILQFAHFLRDRYREAGMEPVKVTANIQVSLNGRPPRHLVDPEADLAAVEPRLWPPAEWILPLDEPRPRIQRFDVSQFAPATNGFDEDESGESLLPRRERKN